VRPKLILLILVIVEAFLLLIFFSPSAGFSKQRIVAVHEHRENPTPETERTARDAVASDRRRPLIVTGLASLNAIAIIWCARRLRQRMA
jgi:hypothetical protein